MTRMIDAEAAALEMVNRLSDLLTGLPVDAPSAGRQALTDARDALQKAADAFADASEAT
ncbi:hypothetical protein [Rhizobium sp. SL42]|uniref:hypothetical protein n=1 Tax=Rhizobium sp. SL42 TaxID=2806346 RepID=UPI001F17B7E5|nr:hypothetical protein [Rhizobium sp. SL42]UJW75931.1 hypothetical protein IM739_05395 [Rhizobium sp. SL42]